MKTCKICNQEKPDRDMRQWGGLPTATCQKCHDAKASGTTALVPAAPQEPPVSEQSGFQIEVSPSFGFTAKLDGDQLVITQASGEREDANAPDNVTLNRDEARALFTMFYGWATRVPA